MIKNLVLNEKGLQEIATRLAVLQEKMMTHYVMSKQESGEGVSYSIATESAHDITVIKSVLSALGIESEFDVKGGNIRYNVGGCYGESAESPAHESI